MERKEIRNTGIQIPVAVDMQGLYDGLVLYRDSLNAQIKVLAQSPSICTHKNTEVIDNGMKVCSNKYCGKIIESKKFDYFK